MRIVSLAPFLTDLICHFGRESQLVGVSNHCVVPQEAALPRMSGEKFDVQAIAALAPDLVVVSITQDLNAHPKQILLKEQSYSKELTDLLGKTVQVRSFYPRRLDHVFETFEGVGKTIQEAQKGKDLAHRMKAQFMDWCDNFYDRMRNKRVSFISCLKPLQIGGFWLPDMAHLASCTSQLLSKGEDDLLVTWDEVSAFRPDVLIVAPRGVKHEEAIRSFKELEKVSGWDNILAVKRGEVFFADGNPHFYSPGSTLLESMAILISCLAGLESGYITPRDSFYRLRFLEMHRHKF